MASTATTEIKDPADLCAHLAPLGHEERLRVLRRILLGELTPAEQFLHDWDKLQLEERWPDAERLTWAWRLATDIDTCADLIAGRAVSPDRLNQHELFIAKNSPLVRLDTRPIDLLEGQAA